MECILEHWVVFRHDPGLEQLNIFFSMGTNSQPVEQISVCLVFILPVVFFKVHHSELPPQVSQLICDSVFLVHGLLEHVSCLGWLELEKVPKEHNRQASHDLVHLRDFSQPQVQVVEKISADHADLVHNDAFQLSEEDPFILSHLVRHGKIARSKFETEQRMESLPVDVSRRCTSEGGENDIGAARVVSFLLQNISHDGVEGVDHFGFSRAGTAVSDYQRRSWSCQVKLLHVTSTIEFSEGHEGSGILHAIGEDPLLHLVQGPSFFNLKRKMIPEIFDVLEHLSNTVQLCTGLPEDVCRAELSP